MSVMGWEWKWSKRALVLVGPEGNSEAILSKQRGEQQLWSTSNGCRGRSESLSGGVKAALKALELPDRLECMLLGEAVEELEHLDRLYARGKNEMESGQ